MLQGNVKNRLDQQSFKYEGAAENTDEEYIKVEKSYSTVDILCYKRLLKTLKSVKMPGQ